MVLVYHFELNIISIGMSLLTLTQSQDQIGHSGGDFPPLQRSQLESTTGSKKECILLIKGENNKKLLQNGYLVMCA